MSVTGLKAYKERLDRSAAELAGRLKDRSEIAVEAEPDEMDNRALAAERELALSRFSTWHRLAREIGAAQRRIEKGTFGVCLRCESPIPAKRLDAVPWAAFCVVCQEIADELQERARLIKERVA